MRYEYEELLQAALAADATAADLEALAGWFADYGVKFWNGECWSLENGKGLYPLYGEEDEEYGVTPVIGYEIR